MMALEASEPSVSKSTQESQSGCCASATIRSSNALEAACCGGPAPIDPSACCVADQDARSSGKTGCGCNTAK
jgi:hypothetical protein